MAKQPPPTPLDGDPRLTLIRPSALTKMLGVSLTTIWRLVRAGTFPKEIQISRRAIGWRASDIAAFLDEANDAGRLRGRARAAPAAAKRDAPRRRRGWRADERPYKNERRSRRHATAPQQNPETETAFNVARAVSNNALTSAESLRSARSASPAGNARTACVRRVTHEQARADCGIRYKSSHLEGVAFPYRDPVDGCVRSWRVRRDHPELAADGSAIAKYVAPPERKHLYLVDGGPLLTDITAPVVIVESEKSVLAIADAGRTPRPLVIATGGCWGCAALRARSRTRTACSLIKKDRSPISTA